MFTGIVQELGTVKDKEETKAGVRLIVHAAEPFLKDLEIGASISVNGVCLTVVEFTKETISFDVIPETLRITNLEFVSVDSQVNLERSLKFGDEVGGHILSGHISCRAPSRLIRKIDEVELVVECPKEWSSYILHKGYVAINGASLTVAEKQEGSFSVYLIPETLNAEVRDEGPGTGITGIFSSLAVRTKRKPGSEIKGVPASLIIAISFP